MNIAALQAALNVRGVNPPLATDGIAGRKTMAAVDAALDAEGIRHPTWSDARKRIAVEQLFYRDLGIEVGAIDGLVGEQTRYAREVYAARTRGDSSAETWRDADEGKPVARIPGKATQWPRQVEVPSFFGAVGTNQVTLDLPFPMRIAWEPSKTVTRVSCHAKVRDSFAGVWQQSVKHYGLARLQQLRLDMFGGCLNVRKMRGGSSWSMHSWGIAWDVDPERNQLKWGRNLASLDDAVYDPFWAIVESYGLVSLGRARNYDWMHFQAARL